MRDLAAVVELRMLEQVEQAAARAVLRRGAAEDDACEPHMHHRAGAHRARLLRHVKLAPVQPPVAEHALGLCDREHLRVRGCVLERLDLVEGARDDPPLMHDDASDRYLVRIECATRLPEGFAHEKLIAVEVNDFVHRSKMPDEFICFTINFR